MLKHLSDLGKLFVAAAAVMIFFPAPAKAQLYDALTVLRLPDRTVFFVPQGYPGALPLSYYPTAFDPYRIWPYASSYPYSPGAYNPLSFVSPLSYAPAAGAAPMSEGTSITLRVPTNAEVWIQGKKMTETGSERRFNLPSLDPLTTYDYDVRVGWSNNGRQVTDTRHLKVRAGDQQSVTYVAATSKPEPGPAPIDNPKK